MMMPLQYPVIHAQRVDPCGYAWILPAILQNKAELLTHQDEQRCPNYVETPLLTKKRRSHAASPLLSRSCYGRRR